MIKKILQIIAVIILILLPYYPITENFFPPEAQVNNETFSAYIIICAVLIVAGILLLFSCLASNRAPGWLLFAMGLITLIPLHLGPPRMNADLLTHAGIEKFRYALLIIATILLFVAGIKTIAPLKSAQSKMILLVLCITALLNVWDNYSSFMLNRDMESWIAGGKNAEDFMMQFDFHIAWRTFARISLYVTAIALSFPLLKRQGIRKWQFAVVNIFCLAGIAFCVLCLLSGFREYYFPFMVPAIALAPAYWLGIAFLTNKQKI
ncbi:MAG: hypothetical protein QM727_03350 [Niabella sp.]